MIGAITHLCGGKEWGAKGGDRPLDIGRDLVQNSRHMTHDAESTRRLDVTQHESQQPVVTGQRSTIIIRPQRKLLFVRVVPPSANPGPVDPSIPVVTDGTASHVVSLRDAMQRWDEYRHSSE
jgi:hypothetical protein